MPRRTFVRMPLGTCQCLPIPSRIPSRGGATMTHLPNGAPIAAIPEALRRRAQWVLWRLDPKDDKPDEPTKVPYADINRKAKANDSRTWLTFDEALRRWAANPNG